MAAAAKSATKKKPAPSNRAAVKATVKKTVAPRTTNSDIQKVVLVSSELGDFLSASQVSRSEAIKKFWAYIKLQNLQIVAPGSEILFEDECLGAASNLWTGIRKLNLCGLAAL
ncbi:hypothetical protein JHK85_019503 [Glycine max]|nr:hypothetical protein JHK85_019503 [Glycine max]KAG5038246.1 hypothetical protein JHK86_019086 [Glycine max]